MKCAKCGYDDAGTGDSAHVCGGIKYDFDSLRNRTPAEAAASNQAEELRAEVSRLTAELAEASRKHVECVTINERLLSDIRCAKAELASLRAQEPVAWMIQHKGLCMGFVPEKEQGTVPVFAQPVPAAQAAPDGWVTMGVDSGDTGLFVFGPYEAIKECQRKILAAAPQPPVSDGDALLYAAEAERIKP